ncbi:MAG: hypothetical protein ACE5HZ_00830 [Fidelibacterota bacterium]
MTVKSRSQAIQIVLAALLAAGCQVPEDRGHPKNVHTENGVLFVDEKPLIPTGIYFWPDISFPTGRNPFEDVREYGLDALVAYYEYVRPGRTVTNQPDIHELRRECDRLGIYYFVGAPTDTALAEKTDTDLEDLFAATTDAVDDSPHFLGWMVDEPVWHGIGLSLMGRIATAIRQHPSRPLIWINFAPLDDLWDTPDWPDMTDYARIADIVSFDFYPVGMGLPWPGFITRSDLEDFGWYVDVGRSWGTPDTPVWMIQQGYQRGDLGEKEPLADSRRPDSLETRFMTFQALAHGASGIFYFPGSRLGGTIPFDDPTWDRYIRSTAQTVKSLAHALAPGESSEQVDGSSQEVRVLTRKLEGKTVILAVRERGETPIQVTFTLSETRAGSFEVLGEDREVWVEEGTFLDSFGPYAVHIYRQQ